MPTRLREKHEGFPGQRLVVVPRPLVTTAVTQPLLKHLLPTDAGYYPRATRHTCARQKGCPEVIFIYCSEGHGWCEIGGHRHEISPNQLLVLPADTPHVYGAAKKNPWTIYWFHAVGTNVPEYVSRLGATVGDPAVPLVGDVQLLALFEDMIEALERGFTLPYLIYAAHTLAHILGLMLRGKAQFTHGATGGRERVARSIDFMKAHLREPLQIPALAAIVNLSRSHYTKLFRRVTGYAPLSYLNHLRMQQAVQLLNTTPLSIKEISDRLGFSDQLYFSRAFRKMHGHSPSDHRLRYTS